MFMQNVMKIRRLDPKLLGGVGVRYMDKLTERSEAISTYPYYNTQSKQNKPTEYFYRCIWIKQDRDSLKLDTQAYARA
jgi:hypothetical protein